jgi:predicted DNA-binding ribbon-helix-helix protein
MKKRSIVIGSHNTSISLEDSFWTSLQRIARERATTVSQLIAALDATRNGGNLSSAVRVFVLDHYRNNELAGLPRHAAPLMQRIALAEADMRDLDSRITQLDAMVRKP